MPSPSERDPWLYVQDMLAFAEQAIGYAEQRAPDSLRAEPMRWDALLHKLVLLGEAAVKVPQDLRSLAPSLPWRSIVATRNRVIHAYLGVDAEIVHSIVHDDLPLLVKALQELLQQGPKR